MTNKISLYRYVAAQSQKWRCYYCEFPMGGKGSPYAKAIPSEKTRLLVTAEHLHARQDGGMDSQVNIVAAHAVCNHCRHKSRRPKPPADYATHVKSRVAKKKWFYSSEFEFLLRAERCIRKGGAAPQFLQSHDGLKMSHPVALRPLKNPS